ncbi:carbohydrate ABC transporter permease [Alkalispirochaeta americana]|uniref:carbohydrate ABC transporter permease n=1 Tax=Alkalispirochaeta americana TaxID=159291 RepID=UPI001F2FF2DD|nr:sugar ABC transporter permease [Alkalispirochaeta americana]
MPKDRNWLRWIEKESTQGYLMIAPNSIGLLVFYIIPILWSVLLAFHQWDGLSAMEWAGINNFRVLVEDVNFLSALRNTAVYTALVVPAILLLVLSFGMLLAHDVLAVTRHLRTLYFLPLMTMPVAAALVWKWLLNMRFGLVNRVLAGLGIDPVPWLSSSSYVLYSIVFIGIWLGVAYNLIVIIAGIRGIPRGYYEAAEIDGASGLDRFFRITLPLLTPSIFFILVTQLITCFQVFDTAFVILGSDPPGSLHRAGSTVVMSIYEQGFVFFNMGYSSAQAVVLFAVVLSITIGQFSFQKRWVHYG